MLIKSSAGEFEFTVHGFEVEGDRLVVLGKMGVWDARTYMEPHELAAILGKLFLAPRMLGFLIKIPFRRRRAPAPDAT